MDGLVPRLSADSMWTHSVVERGRARCLTLVAASEPAIELRRNVSVSVGWAQSVLVDRPSRTDGGKVNKGDSGCLARDCQNHQSRRVLFDKGQFSSHECLRWWAYSVVIRQGAHGVEFAWHKVSNRFTSREG